MKSDDRKKKTLVDYVLSYVNRKKNIIPHFPYISLQNGQKHVSFPLDDFFFVKKIQKLSSPLAGKIATITHSKWVLTESHTLLKKTYN